MSPSADITPYRLLIVEDEALIAEETADRLTRLGYQVLGIADTGPQAIAMAQQVQVDMVQAKGQRHAQPQHTRLDFRGLAREWEIRERIRECRGCVGHDAWFTFWQCRFKWRTAITLMLCEFIFSLRSALTSDNDE